MRDEYAAAQRAGLVDVAAVARPPAGEFALQRLGLEATFGQLAGFQGVEHLHASRHDRVVLNTLVVVIGLLEQGVNFQTSTLGSGVQIAPVGSLGVTGTQGIGVSTPSAAAVADATVACVTRTYAFDKNGNLWVLCSGFVRYIATPPYVVQDTPGTLIRFSPGAPATQSSDIRPGTPARLSRTSTATLAERLTWWAPGASIGLPMVTMPDTRSGRRTARPRASS